ncbi:tetratricopeptide repeat protein [Streptomyces iconiensis]|uniref:Tetratricopeptide repeat protein n=1 Tax=Streptomyces iconiensis TaxID=1384038 RepID=A0ABT6ZZN3_9ACTN|nr:tetratricopeptide repeat protein [Streptomyces iconiensis]MDJ1134519.1 tetratricopeptide repeat protein [Streptomyces iconiensis]
MTEEEGTPRQQIFVESGYGVGVVGGDLSVYQDRGPVYVLLEDRPHVPPDPAWLVEQPSRMLNAHHQVVEFTSREGELAELADWRDASSPRLSACWMHGPGGQGKSRLAAEFAARSAEAGWKVVHAEHGPQWRVLPSPGSQDMRLHGQESGLLLVLDYADRWPASHLSLLFNNKLLHREFPTRCLLLARSKRPWPVVLSALSQVQADTRIQELRPLADGPDERRRVFRVARDCFAARHGLSPADTDTIAPPAALERSAFDLALSVHTAALVAVDARVRGLRTPEDMAGLTSYLLDREAEHWQRLHESGIEGQDYGTRPSTMARAVFAATLTGATTHARGAALLRSLDLDTHPDRVLADHGVCYPPAEQGAVLEPLYPDRLAEDFLALSLPGHDVADYEAKPWAPSTLHALASGDGDPDEPLPHAPRLVTFLAAAAGPGRWPHVARHLGDVLRTDPALAVAAGGAALTALAEVEDLAPDVLAAVTECFPSRRRIDLDVGMAALTARVTRDRLGAATPEDQVRLLLLLARRQKDAGRYEEALEALDRAESVIHAQTSMVLPDGQEFSAPDLALHVDSVKEVFGSMGEFGEALDAIRQTAAMGAVLLVETLDDRSAVLAELGRWQECATNAGAAVRIYDGFLAPDLGDRTEDADAAMAAALLAASALTHLGTALARVGKYQEGLVAGQRAVELYEQAADWIGESDNYGYESSLATALMNHANRLAEADRLQEASDTDTRNVQILRRMVEKYPGRDEAKLARAVSNQSQRLHQLGRLREALVCEREAIARFEELAGVNPAAYEDGLTRCLVRLSGQLLEDGQTEAAREPAQRALDMRTGLLRERPGPYQEALLAEARLALARVLAAGEEPLLAAEQCQAAARTYAHLRRTEPGVYKPWHARALTQLASATLKAGDLPAIERAAGYADEALSLCRGHGIQAREASGRTVAGAAYAALADAVRVLASAQMSGRYGGRPAEVAAGLRFAGSHEAVMAFLVGAMPFLDREDGSGRGGLSPGPDNERTEARELLDAVSTLLPWTSHGMLGRGPEMLRSAVNGERPAELTAEERRLLGLFQEAEESLGRGRPARAYDALCEMARALPAILLQEGDRSEVAHMGLLLGVTKLVASAKAAGRLQGAATVLRQTVDALRALPPARQVGAVDVALSALAEALSGLGHHQEAVRAAGEAAAVVRADEACPAENLVMALTRLALAEAPLGHVESGRRAIEEAVELCRETPGFSDEARAGVARSLRELGDGLAVAGERSLARDCAIQAVEMFTDIATRLPAYESELARGWLDVGIREWNLGRSPHGEGAVDRAIDVGRRWKDHSPEARAALLLALRRRAEMYRAIRAFPQAAEAEAEADTLEAAIPPPTLRRPRTPPKKSQKPKRPKKDEKPKRPKKWK